MNIQSFLRTAPVLLVAGMLPSVWAASLPAVADTYVSSSSPGANFGTAVNLSVAPGNAGLVQFDLSAIPPGTTISAAYLRIFVSSVAPGGTLTFSQVTSAWTEGAVSFSTSPSAASAFAALPVSTAKTFLFVDVTALVNMWLANPATNFGVEITGAGGASVLLDSKENTATSHPATLEISVVGPAGPPGPTGPVGPTGATGPAGAAGPAGVKGATGATGPVGATGAAGATGASGAQGLAGAAGATGPTGPVGPTGATGASGAQGLAGAAGATGASGVVGPTGPTGASGAAGLSGAAGPTGPTGATGPSGAIGPTSNQFNFDTTIHPNNYTIPDTDPFIYYLVNNPLAGGPGNLNLPHANVRGRILIALPANASPVLPPIGNRVQVTCQAGDTILGNGATPVTVVGSQRPLQLMSDGSGHWFFY
jgi:hypothetical protein